MLELVIEPQDRVPISTAIRPKDVSVSFRSLRDHAEASRRWSEVSLDDLEGAAPWRMFRWRNGQRHYSGSYWSATERDHVIYESRLELARLMFADFDTSVRHIVAQPFLLRAKVDGQKRKHVPDYLLITGDGPIVVDVKPKRRLTTPAVACTFAWTKAVIEARGWQHEIASEPATALLNNVAFLAGYRRSWQFNQRLLDELSACNLDGQTLGAATWVIRQWPPALVRATVLHLLWRQIYKVDLRRPLSAMHVLERAT